MKSTEISAAPSLARAFESERRDLQSLLAGEDKSASVIVRETRKALDRTGSVFSQQTDDVQIHKAGLWLLEMVKAGAGVLDTGARAEIVWREVPTQPKREIAGSSIFYMTAAGFAVLGFLQESRTAIMAAAVLAALRFFDPADWKKLLTKIPFMGGKTPAQITGPDGLARLADARLTVNSAGFVDGIADALRTADHILLRLSQPAPEQFWHDNKRLMGFVHGMLEANAAGDGAFALRLIDTELKGALREGGIEAVEYSKKDKRLFDALPGIGIDAKGPVMAAPALVKGEQILRRGTIWTGDEQ